MIGLRDDMVDDMRQLADAVHDFADAHEDLLERIATAADAITRAAADAGEPLEVMVSVVVRRARRRLASASTSWPVARPEAARAAREATPGPESP